MLSLCFVWRRLCSIAAPAVTLDFYKTVQNL